MQTRINIENNNRFSIAENQFVPANYTISIEVPADKQLASFIVQTLQNILLSNNISVTIGGDTIG